MSAPASVVAGDEHGAVGAEREGLTERPHRGLGAHAEHDDLAICTGGALLETQSLLHRVRVERVQRALARAVEPARRRIDATSGGRVRDLLDADGDLHLELPSGPPARGRAGSGDSLREPRGQELDDRARRRARREDLGDTELAQLVGIGSRNRASEHDEHVVGLGRPQKLEDPGH